MTADATAWTAALTDALLPADVSAGAPVRLDCSEHAVRQAAQTLAITPGQAVSSLIACLHAERLVSQQGGVRALARPRAPNPPTYLLGLAVLVLAASRMAGDEQRSMAAYYQRLADLLGIAPANDWPQVRGVPELVARFDDLGRWMRDDERGRRGLLDIPADVHPPVVGVPISQSLLRAGDRVTLGAFFERSARLIDAGWDPVHQLRAWGGRHQLSTPLQNLVDVGEQRRPLAAALRAALRSWDGSTVDASGRRLLAGRLTLHLPPPDLLLAVTVPALSAPLAASGPRGVSVLCDAQRPAAVALDWLAHAQQGPLIASAGDERIRILPGPTILFESTPLGLEGVGAAAEDPVWVLTCQAALIAACPSSQRLTASRLPAGWALLCDVEPDLLPDLLRVQRADEERPLLGVAAVGGLRLRGDVWLADHPPQIIADLPEPAPVSIDGVAHGDLEAGRALDLQVIAGRPGVHQVDVGGQRVTVELAARGTREQTGSLAIDLDPCRVHAGARPLADPARCVIGPLTLPSAADPGTPGLIVRYRCSVDVIDVDGSVRTLGPPPPAAWLEHVGLPQEGPWEIADGGRVAWLCVNAASGKVIVAHQAADVAPTDDVLDVVEWYAQATRIVDRSDGNAPARWQRLLDALAQAA